MRQAFQRTPPKGAAPTNTLTAAQSIARYPWYQPEKLFALLDEFYSVPAGKTMRAVPFMPYLSFPPSAWVLPLKFDGGGYRAGGKAMFDSEGNLWVGDNFTIGWQGQDTLWQGNASKFAPNGRPLSPITTGFAGGGMQGGTFGAAVDAKDNAWLTSYGGKSIAVFDKNGKPLTPPEGITFDGKLGLMQGVIVTPDSDVWVVGITKSQFIHFPKGDLSKGKIVCEGDKEEPCKSFLGPFHLGIDQQNRIWVTNAFGAHVTRFPASDPNKVEKFNTGWSGSGLGIDIQGNVWVTNRLGSSMRGAFVVADMIATLKLGGNADEKLTRAMFKQRGGRDGGSVTLLRPDGSEHPGSPFTGGGLPGPWAATIDGNDNVWISNFAGANSPIVQLCGVRTENCPPGMKTGDQISPQCASFFPGRYLGKAPPELAEVRSALNDMISDTRRTSEVLDGIRALFGKNDQKREQVEVNELILGVLQSSRKELQDHGVETRLDLASELPLVESHRRQLEEVIFNLVHNAIEAMDATADHDHIWCIFYEKSHGMGWV